MRGRGLKQVEDFGIDIHTRVAPMRGRGCVPHMHGDGPNTANVGTLIPVVDRIRNRFNIGRFCIAADWGMISTKTVNDLDERKIPLS